MIIMGNLHVTVEDNTMNGVLKVSGNEEYV